MSDFLMPEILPTSDSPEEIIKRMQEAFKAQNSQEGAGISGVFVSDQNTPPIPQQNIKKEIFPDVKTETFSNSIFKTAPLTTMEWLESLPQPDKNKSEFFIELNENTLFCVRELPWDIAQDIETRSFRRSTDSVEFFAGEYERRETLQEAIIWVAELKEQRIVKNTDGLILRKLKEEVIERLWQKYYPIITINSEEANALYKASSNYFGGKSQTGQPTPSIIIKVDMMLKFGAMTLKELESITVSEMERIQLILMARSEVLGLTKDYSSSITAKTKEEKYLEEMPAYMWPNNEKPRI